MQIDEKIYERMPFELQKLFVKLPNPGSEEVMAAFERFGEKTSGPPREPTGSRKRGMDFHMTDGSGGYGDTGSAARFFYTAKAGPDDRFGSKHPTVKPLALMRWLVRLVTPPGGTVLDPFAGTGSTGVAAHAEGFRSILIEREAEYFADLRERIEFYLGDGRHSLASRKRSIEPDKAAGLDTPLFTDAPLTEAAE